MTYKKIKLWREPDENGDFAPLTERQIERLHQRSFNYCVWTLGKSAKTVKQLRDKMKKKNCPEDIMDATIAKLESYNYVNDEEFSRTFIVSRRLSGWGDRKISMELTFRGVDPELVRGIFEAEEEQLDEDDETEYDRAYRYAERKVRTLPSKLDRRKKIDRTVGAMARRGFSPGIAYGIANELIAEDEQEND